MFWFTFRGPQLQFHLLQLQGYAAIMRRQPLKALHFAKESRMLAENLVISKPSEESEKNSLDWEHLAESYSLISVSAGLCGEVEDSRGAAQKLVQLGKEAKQFHLEAYGEILLATQALARCELPLSDNTSLKHLHHLQFSRRCKDIDEAYAAANMAWQIMRSNSSERFVSLRSAALLKFSQALRFKGQVPEAQKLLQEELRQTRLYQHRGWKAGILIAWASIDPVEALQRLRMLGSDGESGQMEVLFRSTTSSNQIWQDDDIDLSAWDTATSYLQNALTLARAHQDFISEVRILIPKSRSENTQHSPCGSCMNFTFVAGDCFAAFDATAPENRVAASSFGSWYLMFLHSSFVKLCDALRFYLAEPRFGRITCGSLVFFEATLHTSKLKDWIPKILL